MTLIRFILMVLLTGSLVAAAPQGRLDYRMKVRFRGATTPVEIRFALVPLAPLTTQHKVQKPRLGEWRLEVAQAKGNTQPLALLLAKAEGLLYLSGPVRETHLCSFVIHMDGKARPIWQVAVPVHVRAHAFLAELRPGLLALQYFSGVFNEGDAESVEIQLERIQLAAGAVPSANGTALISTLRNLSAHQSPCATSPAESAVERIP